MRVRWFLPVLFTLAVAAPAHAGILVSSASPCYHPPTSQPFLRWLDPASYELAPRGTFEAGTAGWALSGGAAVKAGNEPFYVHGAGESRSLALPAGSSATSPAECVGIGNPTLRFFVRNSGSVLGTLKVEVLFENNAGHVLSTPIGLVTGGAWAPTLPLVVVANLLPLLPYDQTAVAFRFTPVGGSWQVDDVYLDPWNRR